VLHTGLQKFTSKFARPSLSLNAVDVARMELAESGVNKPVNLGLRHLFIQAMCRSGVKSTVLSLSLALVYGVPAVSIATKRPRGVF
jgi:hypothetical protein